MTGGGSGVLKLVPGLDPVSVDTYVTVIGLRRNLHIAMWL
jgi:hypothetical protein